MDRLINDRKRQNSEMKQILKMQDLLEQYDRENAFLNKQVDTLLKQNIKLKHQSATHSYSGSRIIPNDDYSSKKSHSKFAIQEESKTNFLNQPRKSRYAYLFDETELRDLKKNIKKEIKNDTLKHISTKQVQTSSQQIPQFNQLTKSKAQITIQDDKPFENIRLQQSKSTLIRPLSHFRQAQLLQVRKTSPSHSKSKEREGLQQKLEIISKSRIYLEKKQDSTNKVKQSDIQKGQNKNQSANLSKKFYLERSDILEHSFGQVSQQNLEKKRTLLQSDLPSGLHQYKEINESQMTTKFLPLSIESKQLSTNLPPNESRSAFYKEPLVRTQEKPKRKHSLHPSPKVQFNPHLNQPAPQKVKPFVLKTQEAIAESSIKSHLNPSQNIKRKFIKIVSSKKISVEQSPKKK